MKQLYIVAFFVLPFFSAQAQRHIAVLNEMKSHAREEQAAFARLNGLNQTMNMGSLASSNFDVTHYRCEWEINPAVRFITGKVTVTFFAVGSAPSITLDLGNALTTDSVLFRNARVPFTHNADQTLVINFPAAIASGQKESVTIFYKGAPTATGNGSFTTTHHAGVPVLWTLSQPYGSRDWWPCKNGLNDKADSLDVIITCPDAYRGSSNGMLVSDVVAGGKRTSWFKHRYPIASYLVAIACTNYQIQSYNVNINGRNLPFENWTYPESALRFDAESYGVINALQWFSGYFGEYPFMNERYAQTQFSWGGGMEHQTNSFMGGANHILQAHELAHQWFGDKSTCGSWKDIFVNEGITSFAHWLYFERHDMPTFLGIRYEYHQTVTDEPAGSIYVDDTTSVDRIFDWRLTYVKGAFIMHMLRNLLGDNLFFQALKQYGNDPAVKFGYARIPDVKRNFEQVTGRNLTEFFNDWVYGQGHPTYQIKWNNNKNGFTNILVNQLQSHPSVSFFEYPVQLQFKNATRDTIITVDVQRNGQKFFSRLDFVPDTVLIDPNLLLLSKNNTAQKSASVGNNEISIFPNPASGSSWNFSVTNPTATQYTAELYNGHGQLVYRGNFTTAGNDITGEVPNSTLAAGIYTLRISSGGAKLVTKQLLKLN
ncbi:MAG: T9SS type A sorting domain-containing protein [Dinghuibacter sp.]|nr:T9SS type A sorting domain-containing protein [Dinghuibacter sp.]